MIAAEDTRRTGQLLNHAAVETRMLAYHEHSSPKATAGILARLEAGEAVALVSDAGTPAISDPGYRLVRAVQDAGFSVVPIPGCCAVVAAISASGLPSDRFAFEGFLPARQEGRRRRLKSLSTADATLVFYEAPHRLEACLEDMRDIFGGEREAAVARELTKQFETIRRASLGELLVWVQSDRNQTRGELVVLVGPDTGEDVAVVDPDLGELLRGMAEHMSPRQAAKLVATFSGLGARDLYNYLLSHQDD